eukprot:403334965
MKTDIPNENYNPSREQREGGMRTNRRTRAESQWIVGQAYSHTYNTLSQLSRLQTICINNNSKLRFTGKSGPFTASELNQHFLNLGLLAYCFSFIIDRNLHSTSFSANCIYQLSEPTVPLVLSWITVATSLHQQGKTNLSHDGLNPAHVPYQRVNNPTLGEFCFTMIGRADIEESKSNVAMNAWLPQASYPCGNFSDTSSLKLLKQKDRQAMLSQFVFVLKIKIKQAFPLLVYKRFLFSLSLPQDTCVIVQQMCRPSQTPHLTMSSTQISSNAALKPQPLKERALPNGISKMTMRVSQAQQGLLSPLIVPSPFPWLWVRQIVDRDSGNLVNPFMRVTNQMTRHLATLRESQLLPPFTRAWLNFFTLTFRALGRNHIVSTPFQGHHNAWFLLNCRVPLVRSSSESIVHCSGRIAPYLPVGLSSFRARSLWGPQTQNNLTFRAGPDCPILRAIPFPEVTELFCRLPLSTLFQLARGCQPWRPDAVMGTTWCEIISLRFSWTIVNAPDTSKSKVLFQTYNPSSGQSNFRRFTLASLSSLMLPYNTHIQLEEYQPHSLSTTSQRLTQQGFPPCLRIESPVTNCCSHGNLLHFGLQNSHLNNCYYHQDLHQTLFNPGSRQRLRNNAHALLLIAASLSLQWSSIGRTLQRHPFSGLVHSAGELLHTPQRYLMSVQLGTLTRRQEHPSSPVLLTKNGPLGTRIEPPCLNQERPGFLPIQSLRIGRGHCIPEASNHSLYLIKLRICPSYPEGNFGGNQLLDGSISLSPLYPSSTIDLHVRTATSLHQSFPWLHPTQAQFTIFRVLTFMLVLKPFTRGSWSVDAAACAWHQSPSLRVRVGKNHFAKIAEASSGRTSTDIRTLPPEGNRLYRAFVAVRPHLGSRCTLTQSLPQVQTRTFYVSLARNGQATKLCMHRRINFYPFLLNDFKSFDSLFKVLFIFPSQYLFAIGFLLIFSLRRSLSPTQGCNTKQPDSSKTHSLSRDTTYGAFTLSGGPFVVTSAPPPIQEKFECLSTGSCYTALPLLSMSSHCKQCDCCIECDPRRIEAARRAQRNKKTLKQACQKDNLLAPVAFKNLMTHGSAIRIAYRTSLRCNAVLPAYAGCTLLQLQAWLSSCGLVLMILPQVHLRKPCYDFSFLQVIWFTRFSTTPQGHRGPNGSPDHSKSVGATGGVYKGQGLNQRKLMTCAYQEFLVQDLQFQRSIPITTHIADYQLPHGAGKYSLYASVQHACGPGHLRASQTCYCLKLPCVQSQSPSKKSCPLSNGSTSQQAKVSFVNGINQTNHSTNQERPCTTTHRIKKELSICQSSLCLDLVSFPVLSQIEPQAPLLVVPFRQFLQVSALRPYSPQNPKTLISHKVPKADKARLRSLVGIVYGQDQDGI